MRDILSIYELKAGLLERRAQTRSGNIRVNTVFRIEGRPHLQYFVPANAHLNVPAEKWNVVEGQIQIWNKVSAGF